MDLNRAVAVAMAGSIPAGLAMVDRLPASGRLDGYHLLPDQCEGCTFFNSQVRELAYLHARDVTVGGLARRLAADHRPLRAHQRPSHRPVDRLQAGRSDDLGTAGH